MGLGSVLRNGSALVVTFAACFGVLGCGSTQTIAPPKHVPVTSRPAPQKPAPSVTSMPPSKPAPAVTTPSKTTPPAPAPTASRGELRGATIVVDAGHGGTDPGTQGVSKSPEKSITLAIAKELATKLDQHGAHVTMTRTKDVFIELDRRAATADKTKADLLVSVHADSHEDRSIAGATVYVARSASPQSRRVAEAVLRNLKASGIATRGVRSADFRVLVGHRRPSILVECGYLTNQTDARNLGSEAYRRTIATAIANGIADGI